MLRWWGADDGNEGVAYVVVAVLVASSSVMRLCGGDEENVDRWGDEDDDVRLLFSGLTPFVEPGVDFGHKGSVSDILCWVEDARWW